MNRVLRRKRVLDRKAAGDSKQPKTTAATKPRGRPKKRRRTSARAPSATSSDSPQEDPAPPSPPPPSAKPRERAPRPSQRLLKSETPQVPKKRRTKAAVEPVEKTRKSKRASASAPAPSASVSESAEPTPAPTPIKIPPIAPNPPTENEEDDDEDPLDACSSSPDKLYPIGDATRAEIDDYAEKIEKGNYEHARRVFFIAIEKKKGALIEVMKNHRNIWDRRRLGLNRLIHPKVDFEWVNIALEVEKKTGHLYHVATLKQWWNSLCREYKKHIKKGGTFIYFEQLSFMREAADFELARDVNYEAVKVTLIEKQKNAQSLQKSAEPSVVNDDDIRSAAPRNVREPSRLSSGNVEPGTVVSAPPTAGPTASVASSVEPETHSNDDGDEAEMNFDYDDDDYEEVVNNDDDDHKPDLEAQCQDFYIEGDGSNSGEDDDSRPSVIAVLVAEQKPNIGKNNVTVMMEQDQMYSNNGQRETSPTISLATSEDSVFAFDAAGPSSSSAAPASVPSSSHNKKNGTSTVTTSRTTVEIDGETIQIPPLPNQGSFESQTETRKQTIVDSEFIFTSALSALMAVENDETAYNKMKLDLFRVVLNAVDED